MNVTRPLLLRLFHQVKWPITPNKSAGSVRGQCKDKKAALCRLWLHQNSKFQLRENNFVYMFEDMTIALVLSEKNYLDKRTYPKCNMHHQETFLSSLEFNQRVIIDNSTELFCNEIRHFPLSSLKKPNLQTLKTICGQQLSNLSYQLVVKSTYELERGKTNFFDLKNKIVVKNISIWEHLIPQNNGGKK